MIEASKRETIWTAEVRVEGYHHNEWSSTEEEGREGRESVRQRKKQREINTTVL